MRGGQTERLPCKRIFNFGACPLDGRQTQAQISEGVASPQRLQTLRVRRQKQPLQQTALEQNL